MKRITAAMFKKATGRKPVEDDLDRVNCKQAGKTGHFNCGWNHELNAPVFQVGHGKNLRAET